MAKNLDGIKVAFLATDGVEQSELVEPWQALIGAGAEPHLLSLAAGRIQAMTHGEKGETFEVTRPVADASAADYAALVIPGGVASPDSLRTDERAVALVRAFFESDKPVAAICHGPWLLVEADAVRGRTLTSWPSLRTDIRNAGGEWVDKPVCTDQKLITSRKPADLPAFCARIVASFGSVIDDARTDQMSEMSFPASDPPPGPSAIGKSRGGRDAVEPESRAP